MTRWLCAFFAFAFALTVGAVQARAENGVTDTKIVFGTSTNLTGPSPIRANIIKKGYDLYFKKIEGKTRRARGTYNAICLVVSGEGRSTVGEQSFEWSRHDVFTVPHWTWASHEARDSAELFIVTDRAIYERLDLLREEMG